MRYDALPPAVRLASGLFMLSMVYFYVHAQWNLFTNVGKQTMPTVEDILVKYHGKRETTRLESVLDPKRDDRDDLAMYQYLDGDYQGPDTQKERYDKVIAWIRGGATEAEWPTVKEIFTHPKLCISCHKRGEDMGDAPLETFAQVRQFAATDQGPSVGHLNKLSHSHLAGFALIALAASLLFAGTRYRMIVSAPLMLAIFAGPILDVTGWWLTKNDGMPWPYLIIAGGAMFGVSLMIMVVLTLDELWLRGVLGRMAGAIAGVVGLRIRHD